MNTNEKKIGNNPLGLKSGMGQVNLQQVDIGQESLPIPLSVFWFQLYFFRSDPFNIEQLTAVSQYTQTTNVQTFTKGTPGHKTKSFTIRQLLQRLGMTKYFCDVLFVVRNPVHFSPHVLSL